MQLQGQDNGLLQGAEVGWLTELVSPGSPQ